MKYLKFGFALVFMVLAFGCSNQDTIEETQPAEVTVEGQKSLIDETPVPLYTTISIRFPEGYDHLRFMQSYGDEFGLVKARQCPTNANMQIWKVNYMSYNDLGTLLNSLFYDVYAIQGNTTSNGTGSEPMHPPYRTRTAPPTPPDQPQSEFSSEIWFYYGDVCDYD